MTQYFERSVTVNIDYSELPIIITFRHVDGGLCQQFLKTFFVAQFAVLRFAKFAAYRRELRYKNDLRNCWQHLHCRFLRKGSKSYLEVKATQGESAVSKSTLKTVLHFSKRSLRRVRVANKRRKM